jgi:hypothetical protein
MTAFLLAGGLGLLLAGCSGGSGAVPPFSVSPEAAGQEALEEYDTNRDGSLDAKELERCPALKRALAALDRNKDGRVSAQEIADRLAEFQAMNIGLVAVPCRVTLNRNPLEGATVTFIPEKFMGSAAKPASGLSDAEGHVLLRVEGETDAGMQWGYFRVTVSKKDPDGRETLPGRYNTASVLGEEVDPGTRGARTIVLHLTSP